MFPTEFACVIAGSDFQAHSQKIELLGGAADAVPPARKRLGFVEVQLHLLKRVPIAFGGAIQVPLGAEGGEHFVGAH